MFFIRAEICRDLAKSKYFFRCFSCVCSCPGRHVLKLFVASTFLCFPLSVRQCNKSCEIQSFYGRSRRRLLVFDYDGTLVAHHALAQLSAPPAALLQALEALCEVILSHALAQVVLTAVSTRREDATDQQLRMMRCRMCCSSFLIRSLWHFHMCRTWQTWCTSFRAEGNQSWRTG